MFHIFFVYHKFHVFLIKEQKSLSITVYHKWVFSISSMFIFDLFLFFTLYGIDRYC